MTPLDEGSNMEIDEPSSVNAINLESVLEIVKKPLQTGDIWYLVSQKWYEHLERFIEDKEPTHNPGPIDNSSLFQTVSDGWELKNQLNEKQDYEVVPEEAWKLLTDYFGIQDETFIVKREVIEQGVVRRYCLIEVYPMELKLNMCGESKIVTKQYSRMTSLKDLEEDIKQVFNVDSSKETKILQGTTPLDIYEDTYSLTDAHIYTGDTITLKVKSPYGGWSSRSNGTVLRSYTGQRSYVPGLCGLENLGNTCFMNSALQCLSNTPPLTEYITSDKYLKEINKTNPLGMEGKIAQSFGEMVKQMWSGAMNSFSPRQFKFVVGGFAPQFSGYAQHDCQELMAFLLDGLHEDLNRIKKKPYIEIKTDVDSRPDHIVAQESWDNYKKRNDSIIVDIFHGMLKSTLVCPECSLVSVTFDPFCYLSLPLPYKKERKINVIFVPAFTEPDDDQIGYSEVKLNGLPIPKLGYMSDICTAVAKAVNNENIFPRQIDPSKLIVTDVYEHRFHKLFEDGETIIASMKDLVVYETLGDKQHSIPVYLRETDTVGVKKLFGRPFFIGVDLEVEGTRYDKIYEAVNSRLKNYVRDLVDNSSTESDEGVVESENKMTFSLCFTNSFGSLDILELDPNEPVILLATNYIGVDISTETKTKYYDESGLEKTYSIDFERKSPPKNSSIPLSECIMNFTSTEKLEADDSWYCPNCKKHQEATKKFDLWDLPNVLIIHLKRFSYNRYYRDKLDTLVDYPIHGLDMGNYVINNPNKKPILYDLVAVSNHFGSLGGGHYTAYAKNSSTKKWYSFNDSSVSEASENDVVSKACYVLYYLKRTET